MFNECATSAFQRQGSDRYIGHWSLLQPYLKHCYQRASADNISRKFGNLTVFLTSFIIHLNLHEKKGADWMGLRGRSGWSLLLTKSGFSRLSILYRRLVNKANFDNLKVYSVCKYRAKNYAL